jgi:hypothetical protein
MAKSIQNPKSCFETLRVVLLSDKAIHNVSAFRDRGSLSRRVNVPRAPAQIGRARGRAQRGSEVAGDGRERGGNPAAFVFVPRPGRVRLQ